MFDFENLLVYKKSKEFNTTITSFQRDNVLDNVSKYQLRRASFSIMLNIAEGSGRLTMHDKRRFFVMSRGSVFECVAILDYLQDVNEIEKETFNLYYTQLSEISKMLYSMILLLSKA